MKDEEIIRVLKIIMDRMGDRKLVWRLEGSANLKLQGVETSVNDLDIATDVNGFKVFSEILGEYKKEEFRDEAKGFSSLRLEIDGFEVEILLYEDEAKNMFDKVEVTNVNGLMIPLLPLEYAKVFYDLIGYDGKVELIEGHLGK